MVEITSTRQNPMIDPSLHIWGSDITIYLFLGGLVAGIMVLSGFYYFVKGIEGGSPAFIRNSMLATPILLSIGMGFLFLDLENKWNVYKFYMTFQVTSPMSWGAWILLIIYPVSIAMIVMVNRDRWWVNWFPFLEKLAEPFWKVIAGSNIFFGAFLALYTGVLLSTFLARPFWNNGMLPALFLVSAVSSAAAWMILFHDGSDIQEKMDLGLIKLGLIVGEILIIILLISSMLTSVGAQQESIHMILGGEFTALFWIFVVFIGLLMPLLLQVMEILHKVESRYVMPFMVLVGAFFLRHLIVNAGQLSAIAQ